MTSGCELLILKHFHEAGGLFPFIADLDVFSVNVPCPMHCENVV